MANKVCSRREKCPHGAVPQDYSNFAKDPTAKDFHQSQCKDCDKVMRAKVREREKEIADGKFSMFIG